MSKFRDGPYGAFYHIEEDVIVFRQGLFSREELELIQRWAESLPREDREFDPSLGQLWVHRASGKKWTINGSSGYPISEPRDLMSNQVQYVSLFSEDKKEWLREILVDDLMRDYDYDPTFEIRNRG